MVIVIGNGDGQRDILVMGLMMIEMVLVVVYGDECCDGFDANCVKLQNMSLPLVFVVSSFMGKSQPYLIICVFCRGQRCTFNHFRSCVDFNFAVFGRQ